MCETGDTFTRNRVLLVLGAGDAIAFMTAAALTAPPWPPPTTPARSCPKCWCAAARMRSCASAGH
ncbi:MAG: hypothetical protein R3C16_12330 [Hyphomonadaceae bacterium]